MSLAKHDTLALRLAPLSFNWRSTCCGPLLKQPNCERPEGGMSARSVRMRAKPSSRERSRRLSGGRRLRRHLPAVKLRCRQTAWACSATPSPRVTHLTCFNTPKRAVLFQVPCNTITQHRARLTPVPPACELCDSHCAPPSAAARRLPVAPPPPAAVALACCAPSRRAATARPQAPTRFRGLLEPCRLRQAP
jgi:hypothetical protein